MQKEIIAGLEDRIEDYKLANERQNKRHQRELADRQDETAYLKSLKFSHTVNLKAIDELDTRRTRLTNDQTLLETRQLQFDKIMAFKLKSLEEERDITIDSLNVRMKEVKRREEVVSERERQADDANYQKGYAEGVLVGIEKCEYKSSFQETSSQELLKIHALGAYMPKETTTDTPSNASVMLADAFGKHLGNTVDNLFKAEGPESKVNK